MSKQHILDQISTDFLKTRRTKKPITPSREIVAFVVRSSRRLRQWKKLTLASFAAVSLSTVERVERAEKVSNASLQRIAVALGCEHGAFTEPRVPRTDEEVKQELADTYGNLIAVKVEPFCKQRQVRELATCQAILIEHNKLSDVNMDDIVELQEWLDLASYVRNTPARGEDSRIHLRKFYCHILEAVQRFQKRGVTVLAGVMDAPQHGLSEWKVAIVWLCPKLTDPGAINRRYVFVDKRCVELKN